MVGALALFLYKQATENELNLLIGLGCNLLYKYTKRNDSSSYPGRLFEDIFYKWSIVYSSGTFECFSLHG